MAYLTPVHRICRILLPRPSTPKAVLLMSVLLIAAHPSQRKVPAILVKAVCGSLGAANLFRSYPPYNFSGRMAYLASSIMLLLSEIRAVSVCGRNGGIGTPLA